MQNYTVYLTETTQKFKKMLIILKSDGFVINFF